MRNTNLGLPVLTALMLAVAGSTAWAQDNGQAPAGAQTPAPGAQRRQAAPPVHISDLTVPAMDATLKLSDDQKTKIQAVLDKRAADYKTLVLPPDQQGSAPAVQEANRKRLDMTNKADADVEAILTDDQKKMLPDFKRNVGVYQRSGLPLALMADLKLTDDQKQKIADQAMQNQRSMRQKARAAQQAGTAMTGEQRQAMLKENRDKIMALLTPEQRAQVDKYDKEHAGAGTAPTTGGAGNGTNNP